MMFSLGQLPESGTTHRTTPTQALRPVVTGLHVLVSSGLPAHPTPSGGVCFS
nr:MAG TPA: hypothetical protein [Caudoviricetes sp.]